jgi:large subunit ribosomal protein L7e
VVVNVIWYLMNRPFKLSSPKGGFKCKRHPFQTGGDWGNREELINDLVKKMI